MVEKSGAFHERWGIPKIAGQFTMENPKTKMDDFFGFCW